MFSLHSRASCKETSSCMGNAVAPHSCWLVYPLLNSCCKFSTLFLDVVACVVASVGGLGEVADDFGLLPLIKTVIPASCSKGQR